MALRVVVSRLQIVPEDLLQYLRTANPDKTMQESEVKKSQGYPEDRQNFQNQYFCFALFKFQSLLCRHLLILQSNCRICSGGFEDIKTHSNRCNYNDEENRHDEKHPFKPNAISVTLQPVLHGKI